MQLPEHALTLKTLARDGRDAFYRGELAERLHDHSVREGGALRAEDLANHSGMWVDPIALTCGDFTFHQIPPNGQGSCGNWMRGGWIPMGLKGLTWRSKP